MFKSMLMIGLVAVLAVGCVNDPTPQPAVSAMQPTSVPASMQAPKPSSSVVPVNPSQPAPAAKPSPQPVPVPPTASAVIVAPKVLLVKTSGGTSTPVLKFEEPFKIMPTPTPKAVSQVNGFTIWWVDELPKEDGDTAVFASVVPIASLALMDIEPTTKFIAFIGTGVAVAWVLIAQEMPKGIKVPDLLPGAPRGSDHVINHPSGPAGIAFRWAAWNVTWNALLGSFGKFGKQDPWCGERRGSVVVFFAKLAIESTTHKFYYGVGVIINKFNPSQSTGFADEKSDGFSPNGNKWNDFTQVPCPGFDQLKQYATGG